MRLSDPTFQVVEANAPLRLFQQIDETHRSTFDDGFSLAALMPLNSGGVQTKRDNLFIGFERAEVASRIYRLLEEELDFDFIQTYEVKDSSSFKFLQKVAASSYDEGHVVRFNHRPLDHRFVYYDKDLIGRPFYRAGQHMLEPANVAFSLPRQCRQFNGALAVSGVSGQKSFDDYDINLIFPLYLYPEEGTLETERRVNFDPKIYAEIRERAGLSGVDGDELRVFDYIYGVLHSPDYRATFAQFLKIDFPRIPYPASPDVFAHVAEKGGQLRRLHLMEDAIIGATPYPFSGAREDGDDNVVVKPALALSSSPSTSDGEGDRPQGGGGAPPSVADATATSPSQVDGEEQVGRVHINPDQYFDNVPQLAWEFHIGGYQPAQKWLKDRKGRALSFDDVVHYQKIIKILTETDRIMKEIKLPL